MWILTRIHDAEAAFIFAIFPVQPYGPSEVMCRLGRVVRDGVDGTQPDSVRRNRRLTAALRKFAGTVVCGCCSLQVPSSQHAPA